MTALDEIESSPSDESTRSANLRWMTNSLPEFPHSAEEPWVWREDEISMLRAACAKRFDERLRTESLFCIAATGIRIYLARTEAAKPSEQMGDLPRKRGYSEIAEEHIYAKSNLEDKLLELGVTDWEETWTDPYDNSIELGSVDPDARLSPEAQKYLSDEGFTTCWLNHNDGMETAYYKLDGSEGSRRPSPPHRIKAPKYPSTDLKVLREVKAALEHYAYVDNVIVKMMAGFKATPDMVDKNSPANEALAKLDELMKGMG